MAALSGREFNGRCECSSPCSLCLLVFFCALCVFVLSVCCGSLVWCGMVCVLGSHWAGRSGGG